AIPGVIATVTYEPHGAALLLSDYARNRICGQEGQVCCGEFGYCDAGLACGRKGDLPHGRCVSCGEFGCSGASLGIRDHFDTREDDVGPPRALKPGDIQRGMMQIHPRVQACYERFKVPGMVNVTVSINPSGRVSTAQVTGKFAGTATGVCIERAVKSAEFPRFSGPAMSGIDYPFMLTRDD